MPALSTQPSVTCIHREVISSFSEDNPICDISNKTLLASGKNQSSLPLACSHPYKRKHSIQQYTLMEEYSKRRIFFGPSPPKQQPPKKKHFVTSIYRLLWTCSEHLSFFFPSKLTTGNFWQNRKTTRSRYSGIADGRVQNSREIRSSFFLYLYTNLFCNMCQVQNQLLYSEEWANILMKQIWK